MRGEGTEARCGGRRVRRERSGPARPERSGESVPASLECPGPVPPARGRGARAEPAPPGRSGGEGPRFPSGVSGAGTQPDKLASAPDA